MVMSPTLKESTSLQGFELGGIFENSDASVIGDEIPAAIRRSG